MTLEIAITLIGIFVLLVLSAFFNGSETALTAASGPITAMRAVGSAIVASGPKPGPAIA